MAEEIEIQVVHSWDEEEIAALYRAAGWWKEEYRTEDLRHLMRGSYAFAVAAETKTGRAVGMGRVISDGVSDGYVQDLVVLPEFRKSGIGTKIVAALINRCLQAGITWIAVIAEPGTDLFYLPLGFRPMDRYVPLLFRSAP